MTKTALWDKLGKTDPAHTKEFKRAGGFSGTAIKPMFSYHRMTEEFGPCGVGWGINKPEFQVVPAGEDVLVYCTVSIWHEKAENVVYGVGGDKVASKNKNGVFTDDEAFKKAYTDGVTNALKMIGVGADVHMGMFDDQKYVNSMRTEYAPAKPQISEADKSAKAVAYANAAVLVFREMIEPAEKQAYIKANWTKLEACLKYPDAEKVLKDAGIV